MALEPLIGSAPLQSTREAVALAVRRADRDIGGALRFRVIGVLACVLMLNAADQGSVGALATELERSLRISNTQLGVIAAVSALAGAAGTIPIGMLTDRVHRVALLSGSIVVWSAAMLASALAPSYLALVLTRVALGAVAATAGPTVASLTGDFFPAAERAKIWGMILTGQLIGSGIGLVGSGGLGGALGWRFGFGWLAIPGAALALATWKLLSEPARGGQSRLQPAAEELVSGQDAAHAAERQAGADGVEAEVEKEPELAHEVMKERGEKPRGGLVLHDDPVDMPLRAAVRYVLGVPTNRIVIISTALGFFFFAGLQTFAVELMRGRYGLGQAAGSSILVLAGVGAVIGVLVSGRMADWLLARGRPSARVVAGAVGYIGAVAAFVPGLLSDVLFISVPLFVIAGAMLASPDAPLSAARLDIMHPRLWGRAEGVRTVLQMSAFATAPLIFGLVSGFLGGPHASGGANADTKANGTALAHTFLIMLVPLIIAGLCLLRARRTYPRDVATAVASVKETYRDENNGR